MSALGDKTKDLGKQADDAKDTAGSLTKNAEDPADNSKVGNRGGKSDVKQDQDKSENDKGSLRIHINLDLDVEVHISARIKGDITIGLL